jgi:hypothetical protein
MRTYAEVDETNIVINVAVFEDDNTPVELEWPNWYETGEGLRKNIAGPGHTFVPEAEGYPLGLFYGPHFSGWVLDENYDWQPPADKPYPEGFGEEGSLWYWNDTEGDWAEGVEAPLPEEE